jgi:hypothetical protein
MAIQVNAIRQLLIAPESLQVAAIQELGLNIRTAYIRYGERLHPAPEPVTSTLCDEGGAKDKTATEAPSEPVCQCVKTGIVSDTTHCPVHRTNPAPGGVAAPLEASVEDLKPFMSTAWGMPDAMYKVMSRLGLSAGWSAEPSKRLKHLASLTPQQRGQLLKAVRP